MRIPVNVLFGFVLSCAGVWAQAVSTAQINGTVKDSSGLAVPGAEIKMTQTGTGAARSAISAADGGYVLPNLPIGPYVLEVSKEGFSKYVQSGIVLQVDSNPTVDAVLKVGAVTERVVVEADAALVETRSTGVGTVVDQQRVVDLPLNGREATQLIFLSGMATPGNNTNLNTIRNYPTQLISVAGSQSNGITYLLDGATHNDVMNSLNLALPFPDALQEFKVETNALPAQYGLHAAAAVNGVTKSGTNEFHGDVFEFLRNGVLNARDFFASARDTLKRNQFGGTAGGPIRKNKLFFFAGYQGSYIRSDPPQTIAYVPTAAELSGNFAALASPACNAGRQITLSPAYGFVNNQISPALFSQVALNINKLLPSSPDPCGKVLFGITSDSNEHLVVSKVDYQLSPKHSLFGRIVYAHLSGPSSYEPGNALTFVNAQTLDINKSLALGDTYLIGSGTVSSFRATVTRTRVEKISSSFYSWPALGVPDVTSIVPNFSRVTVSGNGFTFGGANMTPSKFNTGPTMQGADDISLVRGSHQIGFGANYIHEEMNFKSGLNTPGGFTFSGTVTGLSMSDYLLGQASAWNQAGFSIGYNRQNYFGMYVQDTWKATSRLTVNYGLRWEPYIAPYSTKDYYAHFDPALFTQNVHSTVYVNAPAGFIFPGDSQWTVGSAPEKSTWGLVVPRVGLVWDPKGNGRMTVRAALGMFTDRQHLFYLDAFANDAPYGNNVTLANVKFSDPWATYSGGNPFPFTLSKNTLFPLAAAIVTHDFNAKPTMLNQWNLSIQRQIGDNWLVTANYIGNSTIHLWTGNQENPAVFLGTSPCTINGANYSVCSTTTNTNQRRMLYLQNPSQGQYYAGITQQDTGGTAEYEALFLSFQRRLNHGVTLQGNYTWSHCISDVENTELGTAGPVYTIPFQRRADRSNCALADLRQVANLSLVAQSPKFSGRALRMLASNWQLSSILAVRSGSVFTVTSGLDNALTGQTTEHPNLVLSNPYAANQSVNQWLNPAAFAQPALGTYGNLGPAILHGPKFLQLDVGLSRNFPIWEKRMLQIRAESFNFLNHLNASTPSAALNTGNFGQITSDVSGTQQGGLLTGGGDPRVIQVAMKFIF
jgi:hypothetical protein